MLKCVIEQGERITLQYYQNGLSYEAYFSPNLIGICS